MGRPNPPFTQEEIDDALTALIAFAGNAAAAVSYLEEEGKRSMTAGTLNNWSRTLHWQRYEELRDKFAEQAEGALANSYLDAARFATETTMLAVQKAHERLESGKDDDPAKTAANLSTVSQRATDKRLALQGRPQRIVETRDVSALVASLLGQGVVHLAESPAQLAEGADGTDGR